MKNKIINQIELEAILDLMRIESQKIVFTNGCFDILHPGHVDYLSKAKKMADVLIVGLNSDASVTRLKGNDRPVNDLRFRSHMLAALESVDFVVAFEEDTPYDLIDLVRPDILVKGSDYDPSEIVGADIVNENGGTVKTIDFLEGYSSSDIINRIKDLRS